MIPTVVLAFALVTSTFALPLTTQEQIAAESEGFSPVHTEVPQAQFVEKTGSDVHPQQVQPSANSNNPVPKVENVPVNVGHPQVSYTEAPVLLPIQPLSVVPQVGQVLRPVIVPAEAITAGRVIIAGIETIQQRNFPDEVAAVEPQVPYQQVVQQVFTPQTQVLEPNQQPYYAQSVEKHTSQQQITPTGQVYVPVQTVQVQTAQEQLAREQNVQQTVDNYNPTPNFEQNAQVYTVPQNVQQIVVPEYPEKQGSFQEVTDYGPSQTVQQQVQQYEEKQVPNPQGSGYGPAQTQGVKYQQQQVYSGSPVVTENVEKQVSQQVSPYVGQQVYDVQQNVEKQGQYQQGYTPVQTQAVEQAPYQKPLQRLEPLELVHQQVNNNQPVEHVQAVQSNPVEQQVYSVQQPSQVSHQQQPVGYVPEQSPKTTEVEQQQVQPEQVVNYASETAYNFGAKIPQQTVQTLSGVLHTQTAPVQPSVASTQQ